MRTSLIEIKQIEDHLLQQLDGSEETLFQAKLILNENLAENIVWQKQSYQLIRSYGRRQLRLELEAIHQKLFTQDNHRSFRQKIMTIFS